MRAALPRRHALAALAVVAAIAAGACGPDQPVSNPATIDPIAAAPGTAASASTVATSPGMGAGAAPSTTLDEPASATQPAVRVDPPYTACQRIATAVGRDRPGTATQVIVRTVGWTDTTATVELARRVSATWVCDEPMVARVGRTGVRPLLDRRSGDGTTPAGVFPLATMTAPDGQEFSFFGNAPDPGVTAGAYRAVQAGDCFGATPNTPGYGHLRRDTSCPGPDDEYLPRFPTTYSNAALIGANMEPDVSGDAPGEIAYASAIFLHRNTYVSGQSGATKPTSGCVSLAQPDLTHVLVAMQPGTQFVIGPTDWLLDTLT